MRAVFGPVALATILLSGTALADAPLALKRVLLSTGGVAYFEREARVEGDAALTLTVRRDQVDDVLKSIVVYDDAGGVGTIDLPGEQPLEAVFRDLPFSQDMLTSPAALLAALRGAEVAVGGARPLTGRVLSVNEETRPLPDQRSETRTRVTLATEDGLNAFILEDAQDLRFLDSTLDSQVKKALAALAALADTGRRTLTVRLTGTAARTVRIGYVATAPLWKATYRLTLPQGEGERGDLQGWAVLENLSGEDWTGVDLTVVSGNPVTFRQNLYAAAFVDRPLVPVEVMGRVLPPPDERAMDYEKREAPMTEAARPVPLAMPAPMAAQAPRAKGAAPAPESIELPSPPPAPAKPQTAEAAEATTQVAFHYPQPVTLANGGSLLMPIVARALPAGMVAFFRPDTHPRHPLAAVRMTNDGDSGLPPGVLTLYERSATGAVAYVGDARLSALPKGERRLLSFAVDQGVTVDRNDRTAQTQTSATVADGVLSVSVTERQTTAYTVAGAADQPRVVVVEHPRRPGWSLIEPAEGVEVTAEAWRAPLTVSAGKTATLSVVTERPRVEKLTLATLAPDRLTALAENGTLPAPVKEAFVQLGRLRAAVTGAERKAKALEGERETVVADQERLRANLAELPKDSALFKRTLTRMGEAETRLEQLSGAIDSAHREQESAQSAVAAHIRGLKI
jgi:hypothetical protein